MTAGTRHPVFQPRGFTLLELILVMIVLCTVLAMAAPSLSGFFSSRQVNDMSEHILMMTRYARLHGIFDSRPHRVNFDLNRQCYWISSITDSQYEPLKTSFGNYFQIPTEITLDFEDVETDGSGVYYLPFNAKGYSREGRVRLEDNRENVLEIVCWSPAEHYEIINPYDDEQNNEY